MEGFASGNSSVFQFKPRLGSQSTNNLLSRMLKARYELRFKAKILSGGKRFKRTKKKAEFTLSDEDMKYLKENTRYDEEEIREWFRWVCIKIWYFWQSWQNCVQWVQSSVPHWSLGSKQHPWDVRYANEDRHQVWDWSWIWTNKIYSEYIMWEPGVKNLRQDLPAFWKKGNLRGSKYKHGRNKWKQNLGSETRSFVCSIRITQAQWTSGWGRSCKTNQTHRID